MLRYAEICVDTDNNNNNDRTDQFTPCAIVQGNKRVRRNSLSVNTLTERDE